MQTLYDLKPFDYFIYHSLAHAPTIICLFPPREGRGRQTPIPSPFSLPDQDPYYGFCPDLPVTTSLRPVLRRAMTANNALPFAGELYVFFLGNWRQLEIEATFVPHALSARASVFEESARLLRLNGRLIEFRLSSESKEGFSRNVWGELTRKDKRLLQSE